MVITVLQLGVLGKYIEVDLKKNPDIQFHAFDPCPDTYLYEQIAKLSYDNLHFYRQAAWIKNEKRIMGVYGKLGQGSSLIPTKGKRLPEDCTTIWPPYSTLVEVDCIDLGEWVQQNLLPDNYNIIMMDIEGAEYYVVPHLIKLGVMTYFKEVYFEGHYRKMLDQEEMYKVHYSIQRWLEENKTPWRGMEEILGVIKRP